MERVIIKALPDPDHKELSQKYVGSKEYIVVGEGPDGKLITGLDENALYISRMEDSIEKKKEQARIIKIRGDLEKSLNVDLGVNSGYWDDFYTVLEEDMELDQTNPKHKLLEVVLIANKRVAPSIDAIENDEDFQNCMYYLYREEEETTKKAQNSLLLDKVRAKIVNIFNENPNKIIQLYAFLFGYSSSVTADRAYLDIKALVEDDSDKAAQKRTIKRVNEALDKSPEDLNTKVLLDKAVKLKIVTGRNNIFRRGEQVLGNSYDEALAYLLSPENSGELISLKKEVKAAQ